MQVSKAVLHCCTHYTDTIFASAQLNRPDIHLVWIHKRHHTVQRQNCVSLN